MMAPMGFTVEREGPIATLVVTGPWDDEARHVVESGSVTGLRLNYALGFAEPDLGFLDPSWGIKRLELVDRSIADLGRLECLTTLVELTVAAAPGAKIDLSALGELRSLGARWGTVADSIDQATQLMDLRTSDYLGTDLEPLRAHVSLNRLAIRGAPSLKSLSGIADLPSLGHLMVARARRLRDLAALIGLRETLVELELEDCPQIGSIEAVTNLTRLEFLGVSDCGTLESLKPLVSLENLRTLHAWGSTTVDDNDLTPLRSLSRHRLTEIRMKSRRTYQPRLEDL